MKVGPSHSNTSPMKMRSRSLSGDSREERANGWDAFSQTQRKWIFVSVCVELFLGQLGFAIFAPFFPQEAASKGVSSMTLGWIFGVFQVVAVAFTPITSCMVSTVGPTKLLNISSGLSGIANILFGLTWYTDPGTRFTILCFATRVAGGVGVSMQMQIGYGLLPCLFEDDVSTSASVVETVIGVACIVAPILGSSLYTIAGGSQGQGYVMPFVLLGCVQCMFGLAMMLWFPTLPSGSSSKLNLGSFSRWALLPFVICILTAASIEYSGPTLQLFLSVAPFNYSVSMVGAAFAVMSILYTLLAVMVGKLDDRFEGEQAVPLMVFGLVLTGIGYIAMAPASWMQLLVPLEVGEPGLWIGICCVSAGSALGLIPTYGNILKYAKQADASDRANATSALFNVSYGLGAFLGPTLGGMLSNYFGIAGSYSGFGAFCLGAAFLLFLVHLCSPKLAMSEDSVSEPFLGRA